MPGIKKKTAIIGVILLSLAVFLVWRFIRPMNIFVVSEAFERPITTAQVPAPLRTLRAKECAACHQAFYKEWATTIHSQAWTDPYFQTDWQFEGSEQICKNCHIPLDRQQEHTVLGFRDTEKWDPILEPNPDFDPVLQHEGVTCAACHLRDGKILGPYGSNTAPHPVEKLANSNEVCARCHVVGGERWDTFFRFPPCGTVAEIEASRTISPGAKLDARSAPEGRGPGMARVKTGQAGRTGEAVIADTASLGCVECHMPLVERPLVADGKVRVTRRHLWRGGHDPEMVKRALKIELKREPGTTADKQRYILTLTNVGAAHYLPTGTPDRHLTVHMRLLDAAGNIIKEQHHMLKRTVMWRPFIVDLWDTRLPYGERRTYTFAFSADKEPKLAVLEAVVRYHLLEEKRRKHIGYENKEPISYEVFRKRIPVH